MPSPPAAPTPLRYAGLLLGATLVAAAISLIAITPKLVPWHDQPLVYETTKVEPMTAQLANPAGWERAYLNEPDFNGIQTIRWRLLPPVVGHALGLSPHAYFTLPWIGALILIGLGTHYALQRKATPWAALAVGVLIGTSSGCFSATGAMGYFDPFYLIPLMLVTFSRSSVVMLAACALGPWVDEKFLFMLPACCLVRWSWQPETRWIRSVIGGIAPYCLIRIGALCMGDSSFSRQIPMQAAVFPDYAPTLPKAWWYGFRAGWVLIFIGLWSASRSLDTRGRWLLLTALVGSVGAVSFLAWDTTRSIAMILPFMVVGLQWNAANRLLPWLALLNLLLPAAYVWCGHPVTVPMTSIFSRW
ncbi:MAG TPA: hypothetical protein VIM71_04770 [Lacunisphaera sp.]